MYIKEAKYGTTYYAKYLVFPATLFVPRKIDNL